MRIAAATIVWSLRPQWLGAKHGIEFLCEKTIQINGLAVIWRVVAAAVQSQWVQKGHANGARGLITVGIKLPDHRGRVQKHPHPSRLIGRGECIAGTAIAKEYLRAPVHCCSLGTMSHWAQARQKVGIRSSSGVQCRSERQAEGLQRALHAS